MGAAILKEAGGELYSKIPGLETLGTGGKIFIKEILEVPKWGVPSAKPRDGGGTAPPVHPMPRTWSSATRR
ncbi:hypothetical protein GCM10029992_16920 [Glycomyces albus]